MYDKNKLGFVNTSIDDILYYESSKCLMYSLLHDYERYILNYEVIPINDFLKTWTCISEPQTFNLKVGDTVYDVNANKYTVERSAYMMDDGTVGIDCIDENELLTYFELGDIYNYDIVNLRMLCDNYKNKLKGENKLCPILITKTKQPQN